MSTGVIITLVAVAILVVAALAFFGTQRSGARGGSLKRRFGPEYERTLRRHGGDSKAADAELKERVRRYGTIEPRPLPVERQEQYTARWAEIQERFVDSPQAAASEAVELLGRLAAERGYPEHQRHEEQVDALSVHHGASVQGYRELRTGAAGQAGTEELRHTMIEARQFFEDLMHAGPTDGGHDRRHSTDRRHGHSRPRMRQLTSHAPHRKGATR